ncbi:MAG: hypothetical protein ABIG89_07555 [Candidatus Woesearchaeota archaeon]
MLKISKGVGLALIVLSLSVTNCRTVCPKNQIDQLSYGTYQALVECVSCDCRTDDDCSSAKPYCDLCTCVQCINDYQCGLDRECRLGSCFLKIDKNYLHGTDMLK